MAQARRPTGGAAAGDYNADIHASCMNVAQSRPVFVLLNVVFYMGYKTNTSFLTFALKRACKAILLWHHIEVSYHCEGPCLNLSALFESGQ